MRQSVHASADSPLLDRVLAIIANRVENGPLPGLREALNLVTERAPKFRRSPDSLVHMDYHPLNVMVDGVRVTGVIDWVNTDVGDRHLDAAMTAVILSSSALENPRWMRDNLVGNGLRASFAALYMPLYHAMAPMDFERFRYCQAVAAAAAALDDGHDARARAGGRRLPARGDRRSHARGRAAAEPLRHPQERRVRPPRRRRAAAGLSRGRRLSHSREKICN